MIVEIVAPDLGGEEGNRDVVFQSLSKLDKYLAHFPDDDIFVRVALRPHAANRDMVHATIDMDLPGGPKAIGDSGGDTAREALHRAAAEVEQQLRKLKDRRRR